jgi:hypothetical protein
MNLLVAYPTLFPLFSSYKYSVIISMFILYFHDSEENDPFPPLGMAIIGFSIPTRDI